MFKIESYKRGIILSTIFNVFNKALTFINGLVVAYFFGAGQGTDIFFFVYSSLVILGTFFMNTNSSVIIPESMRIRSLKGTQEAMQFLNFFILLYLALTIAGLAIIIADATGFFSVISNFDAQQLNDHKTLLYLSTPLFALTCLITLLSDILTSYKFFTVPLAVGIINGLLSTLLILALHKSVGIQSAFYGLLLAYFLNVLLLTYLFKTKLHWRLSLKTANIEKRVWKNIGFAQLGNLASALSLYTPIYILSAFNPGVITALAFAQQISSLPNSLITAQFSSVAGIKFNELFHTSNFFSINKVFTDTANFLHFVMTPISFIIFFCSDEIISVLLGFTAIDTDIAKFISFFLKYLGFLLPFHVSNTLISRLFMASHKIQQAFWYQLIFNIVQIAAVYLAVKQFGPSGYPFTLLSIYLANTLLLFFVERYFFNFIAYGKVLRNLFSFILINAVIAAFIYYFVKSIGIIQGWIVIATTGLLHGLILLMANEILHMNDLVSLQLRSIGDRIINKNVAKGDR